MFTLLLLAAGCSNDIKSLKPPESVVVIGKALQPNGQPITGGQIRFSSVYVANGPNGLESIADIKSDGTFTVKSYSDRDGVVPGTYKLSLSPKAMTGIAAKFQDPESSTIKIEITKETKDLGAIKFQ